MKKLAEYLAFQLVLSLVQIMPIEMCAQRLPRGGLAGFRRTRFSTKNHRGQFARRLSGSQRPPLPGDVAIHVVSLMPDGLRDCSRAAEDPRFELAPICLH